MQSKRKKKIYEGECESHHTDTFFSPTTSTSLLKMTNHCHGLGNLKLKYKNLMEGIEIITALTQIRSPTDHEESDQRDCGLCDHESTAGWTRKKAATNAEEKICR